jgi:pimeloyl-ACP methyl ester carboxylesterase
MRFTRRQAIAAAGLGMVDIPRRVAAGAPILEAPQMVDIGRRRLALTDAGTGEPAVILEAGLTAAAVTWYKVIPGIATFTRACAYDRANLGRSDPAPKPRTAADAATDLAALLRTAHIPAPYVLVGSSFGGYTVRLFAAAHPDEVAGMVLVDASHEDQARRLAEVLTPGQVEQLMLTAPRNIEGMDLPATWDEMSAAGPLPDIPLVVLSAQADKPAPAGFPADAMNRMWGELQDDLAGLSPDSLHLMVNTHHAIALDRPDVVVDAVRRVIEVVRTGRPLLPPSGSPSPYRGLHTPDAG